MSPLLPTWSLAFLIFLIKSVHGGEIQLENQDLYEGRANAVNHISDGEFGHASTHEENFSIVNNSSSFVLSDGTCEHLYGFFPCSENLAGHLFQAVVYQYLMGIGGQLVAVGSKKLFTMLGTGVFGASLFRILLNFPRLIFVIMSGALASEAEAQQQVAMSVAIYAGSTIFVLTIVWGLIVIFARRDLSQKSFCVPKSSISTPLLDNQNAASQNSSSTPKPIEDKDIFSQLKETGVTTDDNTSLTAGILLISLIPFVVAWIAILLCSSTPSQSHLVMLVTLIASFASMLGYFIYQLWDPWMQQRSLEYSKYENLLSGFMKYVQKQTKGKLVDENGQPNIPAIGSLFTENDHDQDKSLTGEEIQKLMEKIQTGEVQVDKEYAISQVLEVFDLNSDGRISEQEFVEGSKKWIEEANKLEANGDASTTINNDDSVNEFINTFTKKTKDKLNEIEGLMGHVYKNVRSKALEVNRTILNDDGSPNIEGIQTIFKQFVSVGKDNLSHSELKQLIKTVKFGDEQENHDETVIKVMKGNEKVDIGEFVNVVRTKWLVESDVQENKPESGNKWDEVDNLFKVQQTGNIKEKLQLVWTFAQPILQIIWGVAMLTLLARPLMSSIISFSFAVGIDSFYICYIIVPIVMNMKGVMSAIFPAAQKCTRTSSLTFSELYGGLVTNNLIGLTTVLGIVYAKNLPWDYSAEMLIIIVASSIVGFFAFYTTTYPLWTCIFAFLLYFLSFGLYCVVHYVWGWN